MKRIGLVGGLGVGAAIHYYKHLSDAFVARGVQPGLVMSHADIGRAYTLVQQGEMDALAAYLNEHLRILADAGCDFAAIAAVTPLICAPQLDAISALPRVDVFDSVNAELKRRGARRVAVLGTQFVMDTDMFGRLDGVEIVKPSAAEAALVRDNYLIIARMGGVEHADIEGVRAIGKSLAQAGADAVILAGTELSLAFTEENAGFPALDSGRVHIDAIVARALDS
ncbi:MAG: aspartate/glutamate racemase family protein [Hyphomonadaceae bacterium]